MFKEIIIGETYHGRVTGTKEFGAFVEVLPGKEGLVHISELADFRVRRTEDVPGVPQWYVDDPFGNRIEFLPA